MKHEPRPLKNVLHSVLKEIDAYDDYLRYWLLQHWNEVMEDPIAKVCRPVKFQGNTLILEAISESWVNELENYKNRIKYLLNTKFKRLKIEKIKII